MNHTDKRRARRFPMHLPVSIRTGAATDPLEKVHTRDVSSHGIFFEYDSVFRVGALVEFLVTLPEPHIKGSPVRIKCLGKIVRVVQDGKGSSAHNGIAATIERYEFVRED